jgi:serine/threonine protein kinase
VRKLGEGGMGAVLEAIQEPIGRRVAVKVLHRKYAQEPSITARFFNEARAVNLIDHPGIVQVSDYGQLPDGTAYLVMEFLKGETLNLRAKRGGMSLPDIVRVARQIAAALAAAHEKNVFHRDLKPDNIMIVPDHDADTPGRERVKILDFGIAKVAAAEEDAKAPKTATDVVMGTPRYMAPEQCRGGVAVDGKADVYSMGVLLYELLAGKPPFSGASGEVLAMHIYEQPPPLRQAAPHVPEEFTVLIHRLLAKKKEERPSMAEVQVALEQMSVRHPTSVLQAIKWTPPPGGGSTPQSTPSLTPASGSGVPALASTIGTGQAESMSPSRRSRLLIPLLTAAVALITGGTLWRLTRPPPLPMKPPIAVEKPLAEKPTPEVTPPVKPATVEVTPLKVKYSITTTPPGAQVLRLGETRPIGVTPWNVTEDAAPGQLALRLRLPGYAEKIIHLDRSVDATRSETLEPVKRPWRPGIGIRPGTRPGQNPGGKPNPNVPKNPPKDETPRIVD